jgi:hypothetical protein
VHMTVLVKLPIEIYHGFMGRCPLSSREYAILKNSLSIHIPKESRDENKEFLCRIGEAKLLLDHAWQFYPNAVLYIEDGISLAHFGSGAGSLCSPGEESLFMAVAPIRTNCNP